ncbi:hypothetical protein BH11CYA1_BH11CYA1_07510 [soil metagenome]
MNREEIKSSMSSEERARRRTAVGKAASEKIGKSEQLNFRIEEQSINELQEMALRKGVPVGAMVRDWVLERLSIEKLGTPEMTGRALHVLDEIHGKLTGLFNNKDQPQQENCYLAPIPPTGVYKYASKSSEVNETPCFENSSYLPRSNDQQLEHLKAWEHVLADQLNTIRQQLDATKHSQL